MVEDQRRALDEEIADFQRRKVILTFNIVKLREREGHRVDSGRSLKGHLLMIDYRVFNLQD